MIKILRYLFYGSRPYIAIHYIFPTAFGIFLGARIFNEPIYFLKSCLVLLSVFFSFQASVILNDFNDTRADTISKKRTPINDGDISTREYQKLAVICLITSFVLAVGISYRTFLIVILGNILHFSYSSKPFRLKRFYPLSIFLLALGALLAAIAGYSLYEPSRPFLSFPLRASIFVVVPLFLALNFRDLADYEGDLKTDTTTLFTLIGLKNGRIVNAVMVLLSYISLPIILRYPLLFAACIPLGVASSYVCIQKDFRERRIFLLYFVLIGVLTVLFNLNPSIITT
ncbi:MAG: UbiA family prenyltransferase [candidate division WOR-3 bacterium]|nr:MAG: UbiA family prenyltransferase [candidate division WOR-3 bacterium]